MGVLASAYLRCLQAVGRRLNYGTSVYEHDWDVLVVLDACRPDTLRDVAYGYEFLDDIGSVRSVGSCSSEWLENTFQVAGRSAEVRRTAMVTANTWTDRYLDASRFDVLDEVWKYVWDDDPGTVPADAVTDRAVSVARERDPDRLVVHYMQPHHPFVPDPLENDSGMARTGARSSETSPWVLLRNGVITERRVREAFEANLRYVLRSVRTLVENVDGQVVLTADHGNLFGEWGLYGHPMHTPVPSLLDVPWAETTATDRGTHRPTLEPPEKLPVSRVYGAETDRDRLGALGYL
jgi:hypothetical protein